ncbi:unnamed protein product [Cuscuta epithymum]|uniref:Protein PHLOEM PROTEIN 2-LIKE A10 n=1 Tax=Cuscuta epithymum TaxID=186058 RepID=A0AAV0E9E7_9ASTE|nr:unnamed protein product [Cuscuta epithymum]
MGFELVKKRMMLTPKRKWLIALGVVGASSYGAYRVYNSRKTRRIMKLLGALSSMCEMMSESAEAVSIISKDLKGFLHSDSDEIPNSLKQLSKIARSEEFSKSLCRLSESVTYGVLRGYNSHEKSTEIEEAKSSTFLDKLMDKLISSSGTGFVSAVVGSFAKNLVTEVYSHTQSHSSSLPGWVDVVCEDRFKIVIAECIKTFVSTAVTIYLDKTMHINFYDDLFSGMTNPKHKSEVRDAIVSLCNGAVETLVKTSHQVTDKQSKGLWLSNVSSTLAVPRNRRFVLDVTGRVTFGTVRSIVEFVMWKMSESLKASVDVVKQEVFQRGIDGMRYICAKSSVILVICFALVLHVIGSTHTLLRAQI